MAVRLRLNSPTLEVMNQHPIRIAIADDEELVRAGFVSMLNNDEFSVVNEFNNAEEIMEDCPKIGVDIFLMDINMRGKGGIEATRWLTQNRPRINVIAVTALEDDVSIIRMIKAGAKAYILKSEKKEVLHEAIRSVQQTGQYMNSHISGRLMKVVQDGGLKDGLKAAFELQPREVEYIQLLSEGQTNKEIAKKFNQSPRTTEAWRSALVSKFRVRNATELVVFALRNGIIH